MKVLGFAASNHTKSINKQLVQAAFDLTEGIETEILDLNDYEMPLFSMEREARDGHPQEAKDFLAKLKEYDAFIVSFAEYNRSVTPAFKNIVDCASRIERFVFQKKPVLLMAATPGGAAGSRVLEHAQVFMPHIGAEVAGTFFLPAFKGNFQDGKIVNEEKEKELKETLKTFLQTVEAAQA